jgi:hypothetical protein
MAMTVAKKGGDVDYSIKPEAVVPAVDTSTWPLLLKNYDKREFDLGSMDRNIRGCVCELHANSCLNSSRSHWTLHPNPERLHATQERSQVIC